MKNFLRYIFPSFLLLSLLVNLFFKEINFNNSEEAIDYFTEVEDYAGVVELYNELIKRDSTNVTYHFKLLEAYFKQKESSVLWKNNGKISKTNLFLQYGNYSESTNEKSRNIGCFGLGVIYYHLQLYDKSFAYFSKISEDNYPYLNFFKGRYYHFINYTQSLKFYNQELLVNPTANFVFQKKAELFIVNEQLDSLLNLLQNHQANSTIDLPAKRFAYFHSGKIGLYLKSILDRVIRSANLFGFSGAVVILLVWLVYLFMIRSRSKNKVHFVVLAILLGMLFALLTSVLTDINKYYFDFSLNGVWLNDFLYAVVGIGFVEELVKIIPFLVLLALNKNIKEPIDYIFYAGLTALGFSFIENIIYFDSTGIKTMQGRALTATVTHLFNTSLIAYGIVLGRFSKRYSVGINFLVFYVLAGLSHGFYDFWLINSTANQFSFLTFLYLLISMVIWVSIINNCINNSYHQQARWRYNPRFINNFLLFSLSFIFLFQYFLVAYKYGATLANYELQKDILSGLFLLIFLTINLSKFEYIPNHWAPLKIWDWDVFVNIPMVNPTYFNVSELLGKQVRINSYGKYGALHSILPIEGVILSREIVGKDKNWFLVSVDQPFKVGWNTYDYLLISTRFDNELLLEKSQQMVQVRLVKNIEQINKRGKRKKDFLFIDFALVELTN